MTDYAPVYMPGAAISSTASAAMTGGDPLVVSGDGTVAPATTANALNVVGTAAHDAANGARVTLFGRGTVHESISDGAITAGDQVASTATADRQVKAQTAASTAVVADINNARSIIGVALTTAADNELVRWMEV